jgi:CHAT domain-containing protein
MFYVRSMVLVGLMMGLVGLPPMAGSIGIAAAEAQTTGSRQAEADRLFRQGLQQIQSSQFEAALQSWQQALVMYRELKYRTQEGAALGNLGVAYQSLENYSKAIDYQEQSLAIAREMKHREGEEKALGNLGVAYRFLGNYSKAIDYQEQSLAIAREMKHREGEEKALGNLGIAYQFLGNYSKAIDYQEQSLAIARELKIREDEGKALGNLANIYDALGDYGKVISYQAERLSIVRELKDSHEEAQILGYLGIAYYYLSDYAKAADYQQRSLAIFRELKDLRGEGGALGRLGDIFGVIGDFTKSFEYYQRYLAIAREIKDRQGEGRALEGLGQTFTSTGNYAEALKYQEQSLAITRELKDQRGEGRTLGHLGVIYRRLGNYGKAVSHYEQSLSIARKFRDKQAELVALSSLGIAYGALNNYLEALNYYEQGLTIAREIKSRNAESIVLSGLGSLYSQSGNYNRAIYYYEQSVVITRAIKDRQSQVALLNLGTNYGFLGNHSKAIYYYEQGLAIARELKDPDAESNALHNLGSSLLQVNRLADSELALRLAISAQESLRIGLVDANKVSLAETQASTYRILQKVLIRQNRPDAALEIAEQGRARAFAELLASRFQNKSIAEIQAIAKPPNLEAIRRIAKTQNATLVEYSIIDSSTLYIWMIKPTGEITFRTTSLDPKVPITQLVENSRQSIAVRGNSSNAATPKGDLNQLHKLLIAPIAADLPKDPNQRIIFLPQGPLFLVPFAALQDDQGRYLIDQHTLSTAPSIQTLQLTREQAKLAQTNGNQLIVGDPTMPSFENVQLGNLPGARQEAIAIAKLLNTQPLIGGQATKAAVVKQMPTAGLIHFATHGLLNNVPGDVPGAIVFAASDQDNGLLSASEIFDLKIKADLVVLSACDTGRGAITGDGVIGLSRSLIAAGAPSIVVSLWAVNDSSTSLLMSEFYRNLKTNPDKAQALRQATLTTKKNFPNPRDWAAFTLIGESNRD